jgi:hypothetical protein
VVKPKGKRSLGKSVLKKGGGDNLKIDLQEVWWEGMD